MSMTVWMHGFSCVDSPDRSMDGCVLPLAAWLDPSVPFPSAEMTVFLVIISTFVKIEGKKV